MAALTARIRNGKTAPFDTQEDPSVVEEPGLAVTLARSDDDALKKSTLNGDVSSAIADTGASATCVQPSTEQIQLSGCGAYGWAGPAFYPTKAFVQS